MRDTSAHPVGTRPGNRAAPLSEIHAEALWRPLPPVGYDDDGYPFESRNVSESTGHDDVLNYFRNAAFALLVDQPDAMVQQRLLILFEQGNRTAAIEPDITVALGVGRHPRNSYKIWVEGRPPDLVVEGLSNKTWRRDVDVKPALYRDLGVREYWQVDPIGRIREPISGYRLEKGMYRPIAPSRLGIYRSDVLDAEISYDRKEMSMLNARTGEHVPLVYDALRGRDDALRQRDDLLRQRDSALRQRDEERKAHEAALARIAELGARLKP